MADLAGLAGQLMQESPLAVGAVGGAARGMRASQNRDLAMTLMELAKQSQAATDRYQNSLSDKMVADIAEEQRTQKLRDFSAQAKAQGDIAKAQKDTYDLNFNKTFAGLSQAVQSGNMMQGVQFLKQGIESGVIPQEAAEAFKTSRDKGAFLKNLTTKLWQTAEYERDLALQRERNAGSVASARAGRDPRLDQVRAQMQQMINQYGDKAMEMPQFKALAAVISPTGLFSEANTERRISAADIQNRKKALQDEIKSVLTPMSRKQEARAELDALNSQTGTKQIGGKAVPKVSDLSDDEILRQLSQ